MADLFVDFTAGSNDDGASWATPIDSWANLVASLDDGGSEYDHGSGDIIHIKEGTSVLVAHTGLFWWDVDVRGGYASGLTGTDTSGRDPRTYRTIVDGNGLYRVLYAYGSNPTIDGVEFKDAHHDTQSGPAIRVLSGVYSIDNCRFYGCTGLYGSAIGTENSYGMVDKCYFYENNTTDSWGCLYFEESGIQGGDIVIRNSVFFDNEGSQTAIYNHSCAIKIINSTFADNVDDTDSTAECVRIANGAGDTDIINTLMWGNASLNSHVQNIQVDGGYTGTLTVSYSLIGSDTAAYTGTGNINMTGGTSPSFADDGTIDRYDLVSSGTHVDSGDDGDADFSSTDILGSNRGTTPDMGAYEYDVTSGALDGISASSSTLDGSLGVTGPMVAEMTGESSVTATIQIPADYILVDHTNYTECDAYPLDVMDDIRNQTWWFSHQSVGNNLCAGLDLLETDDATRYNQDIIWPVGYTGSQGAEGRWGNGWCSSLYNELPGKLEDFKTHVSAYYLTNEIMCLKFCWADEWYPENDFTTVNHVDVQDYIDTMDWLETNYPDNQFFYMTTALLKIERDTENYRLERYVSRRLQQLNDDIRAHCAANNKNLLDIASVIAHGNDGIEELSNQYNTDYDPDCPYGDQIIHPDFYAADSHLILTLDAAGQVAKAIWTMLGRVIDDDSAGVRVMEATGTSTSTATAPSLQGNQSISGSCDSSSAALGSLSGGSTNPPIWWCANVDWKIQPQDTPPTIDPGVNDEIALFGPRNSWQVYQIGINGGSLGINSVVLTPGVLTSTTEPSDTIAASNVVLYRQHNIDYTGLDFSWRDVGNFPVQPFGSTPTSATDNEVPDPLIPMLNPYPPIESGVDLELGAYVGNDFSIPLETNTPIWVDLNIPSGTEPGVYEGIIGLSFSGGSSDIPISVEVIAVDLPTIDDEDGICMWGKNSKQDFGSYHRLLEYSSLTDQRSMELVRRYENMAHEHRNTTTQRYIEWPGEFYAQAYTPPSEATWTHALNGYSGFNQGITGYLSGARFDDGLPDGLIEPREYSGIFLAPGSSTFGWGVDYATDAEYEAMGLELYNRGIAGGWWDKLFVFTKDEAGPYYYDRIVRDCGLLNSASSTYFEKVFATIQAYETNIHQLEDSVGIWCINPPWYNFGDYYKANDDDWYRYYNQRFGRTGFYNWDNLRANGSTIWLYESDSSSPPIPGYASTSLSLIEPQILQWAFFYERATGCLYWDLGAWLMTNGGTDPWGPGVAAGKIGDGVLVYPGHHDGTLSPAGSPSTVSIDGPVPSVRLKMIRQGLQDWALFNYASRLGFEEFTRAQVGSIYRQMHFGTEYVNPGSPQEADRALAWDHDIDAMDVVRRAVLEKIRDGHSRFTSSSWDNCEGKGEYALSDNGKWVGNVLTSSTRETEVYRVATDGSATSTAALSLGTTRYTETPQNITNFKLVSNIGTSDTQIQVQYRTPYVGYSGVDADYYFPEGGDVKLDDEAMTINSVDLTYLDSNTIDSLVFNVTRGARSTTPAAHTITPDVDDQYFHRYGAHLRSSVSSTATSFSILGTDILWPGDLILVDSELIRINRSESDVVYVTRGENDTAAALHNINSDILVVSRFVDTNQSGIWEKGDIVRLGSECMLVEAFLSGRLMVRRAVQNTTPVSHAGGTTIYKMGALDMPNSDKALGVPLITGVYEPLTSAGYIRTDDDDTYAVLSMYVNTPNVDITEHNICFSENGFNAYLTMTTNLSAGTFRLGYGQDDGAGEYIVTIPYDLSMEEWYDIHTHFAWSEPKDTATTHAYAVKVFDSLGEQVIDVISTPKVCNALDTGFTIGVPSETGADTNPFLLVDSVAFGAEGWLNDVDDAVIGFSGYSRSVSEFVAAMVVLTSDIDMTSRSSATGLLGNTAFISGNAISSSLGDTTLSSPALLVADSLSSSAAEATVLGIINMNATSTSSSNGVATRIDLGVPVFGNALSSSSWDATLASLALLVGDVLSASSADVTASSGSEMVASSQSTSSGAVTDLNLGITIDGILRSQSTGHSVSASDIGMAGNCISSSTMSLYVRPVDDQRTEIVPFIFYM